MKEYLMTLSNIFLTPAYFLFDLSVFILFLFLLLFIIDILVGGIFSAAFEDFADNIDFDSEASIIEGDTSTTPEGIMDNTRYSLEEKKDKLPVMLRLTLFFTSLSIISVITVQIISIFYPSFNFSGISKSLFFYVVLISTFIFEFIVALRISKIIGKWIAKNLNISSAAVAEKSFVGEYAIITGGKATSKLSAEAKLKDLYNHTHYIFVKPEKEGEELNSGEKVLLTKYLGHSLFLAKKVN